jgi:hypothetical protein
MLHNISFWVCVLSLLALYLLAMVARRKMKRDFQTLSDEEVLNDDDQTRELDLEKGGQPVV